MGLLSDPSLTPRNKVGRLLAQHCGKINLLFFVAGLAWFVCLAHPNFNHSTYLSENALSPGLVYPEVKQDSGRLAQSLTEELRRERAARTSTTPHAWIVAKMMQIGLETHVHNFTLTMGGKEYHGKNVYGILRAPRIGSTEGIVFAAPYRAPASVHEEIAASVPVLLAFAEFARRKNYWAKDLIFLVTEQEQLGMHAWLEAYYEGGIHDSAVLRCGSLPARAGALQAALNLEIQDLDIDYIDVKIEGLNGQLPNLDMFNLVQRINSREGISSGYKQTPKKKRRHNKKSVEHNLRHMVAMLMSQATGVPNGNHGLFHRYRVEALTLEAVKRTTNNAGHGHGNGADSRHSLALPLLKAVEGISRSLNNLLERFHQSYFFYILVANDRFVSIGDFMPCLVLLISPMFLKAFLLWLTVTGDKDDGEKPAAAEHETPTNQRPPSTWSDLHLPYSAVVLYVLLPVGLGLLSTLLPANQYLRDYLAALGFNTAPAVGLVSGLIIVAGFVLPLFVTLPSGGLVLLHIGTFVFLAIALIVVGLLNFALGFILAIAAAPLAILLDTKASSHTGNALRRLLSVVYLVLLNPLVATYLLVFVLAIFQFPELTLLENVVRAVPPTMDAITFALMDYMIYGNWLYRAITAVFFPLWTMCWTLALSRHPPAAAAPAAPATAAAAPAARAAAAAIENAPKKTN